MESFSPDRLSLPSHLCAVLTLFMLTVSLLLIFLSSLVIVCSCEFSIEL